MSKNKQPIIIKKIKKGGHGGHHGGAWKVAYADFVTAMMAFFLLLWLLNSVPTKNLRGIADYFTPTIGIVNMSGIHFENEDTITPKDPDDPHSSQQKAIIFGAKTIGPLIKLPDPSIQEQIEHVEAKNFSSLEHDLYKAIHDNPELKEYSENVIIDQTPEGLRIQIIDDQKKPMFETGTTILMPYIKDILRIVASQIKLLPNYISISGHTNSDNRFGRNDSDFDNWVLSADRANATRRFLVENNLIDKDQVARIVGKADVEPLDPEHPDSVSNIRLAIVLLKNSIAPFEKQPAPDSLLFDPKQTDQPGDNKNLVPSLGTQTGSGDNTAPIPIPGTNSNNSIPPSGSVR